MEIYGRGFAVALDNQAFHQHVGTIGLREQGLERFLYECVAIRRHAHSLWRDRNEAEAWPIGAAAPGIRVGWRV
jgi:hypothetical protein